MGSSAVLDASAPAWPRAHAPNADPPAGATRADAAHANAAHANAARTGGELRHSAAWEDHLVLERALGAAGAGEILVVAGAGCNVLNLLVRAPRRVVAVDVNPAQAALLELKLAAARRLTHDAFLRLLGIRAAAADPAADRLALYERVRPLLSRGARAWWDAHAPVLAAGPDGAGRLDRYVAGFRRAHLERLTEPGVVDRLLATDDPAARARLAGTALFTPAFVRAFRAYFACDAGVARGRDPAACRYVAHRDVTGALLCRLRRACTELPVRGNFYLERLLRGGLRDVASGPPYLRRDAFERLGALAPRVEVVADDVGAYLASRPTASLHGAALSDVFASLAPPAADALFGELARVLRPRGRAAYWTLFAPPAHPATLGARLRPLERLSCALAQRDRAWLYGGFRVDEAAR